MVLLDGITPSSSSSAAAQRSYYLIGDRAEVGSFTGPVVTHDPHSVQQACFVVMMRLAVTHQLVEHGQIDTLETLSLQYAPILIPAFQERSLVEGHCIL